MVLALEGDSTMTRWRCLAAPAVEAVPRLGPRPRAPKPPARPLLEGGGAAATTPAVPPLAAAPLAPPFVARLAMLFLPLQNPGRSSHPPAGDNDHPVTVGCR